MTDAYTFTDKDGIRRTVTMKQIIRSMISDPARRATLALLLEQADRRDREEGDRVAAELADLPENVIPIRLRA